MTVVYVSGPMTGIPEHNFPAFNAAARALAAAGFEVLNPAQHGADPSFSWADYLRRDLADVLVADALALLDGWESSKGARLEVHVAQSLGVPCCLLADVLALDSAHPVAPQVARVAPDDVAVAQAAGVLVTEVTRPDGSTRREHVGLDG